MTAIVRSLFALSILALLPAQVSAQAEAGLGAPIVDAKLGDGSVVVRVVNGSMSRPMSALGVSLVDDASGKELVVRTGPDGRAQFNGLGKGRQYTAFIKVGDKEASSQPIKLPSAGGVRVLLSPVPLRAEPAAGGQGGPAAAGAGGPMMDTRRVSGVPRPEAKDPPGKLTVRTVLGQFRVDEVTNTRVADFPKEGKVHLVGLSVGNKLSVVTKQVDEGGRAIFDGLKTDNSTSYYVFAAFGRDGKFDRLQAPSIELPPQVGLRVMLAAHAADSTAEPIDDLPAHKRGPISVPAGEVRVSIAGDGKPITNLELLDVATMKVVGSTRPVLESRRSQVQKRFDKPAMDPALRDGIIQVMVAGPKGPLSGAKVSLLETTDADPGAPSTPVEKITDGTGIATFEGLTAGTRYSVTAAAVGTDVSTNFVMPAKGGAKLGARFAWRELPPALNAVFTGVGQGIFIARAKDERGLYYSPPFQTVPDRGAQIEMLIYPGLAFMFRGEAELDDQRMFFRMRMTIYNPSELPYESGNGVLIPLPDGFVGADVAEEMKTRVGIEDHGFMWRGPVPPGSASFNVGFALPVNGGKVDVNMPLPFGAVDSMLMVEDFPGMTLNVPSSAQRRSLKAPNGRKFTSLEPIRIRPGQSLVLSMTGLPQPPSWKRWLPIIAGFGVLALLLWGFVAIFIYRGGRGFSGPPSLERERDDLLNRMVKLDEQIAKQSGKGKKAALKRMQSQRRDLMSELETIYEKLEE